MRSEIFQQCRGQVLTRIQEDKNQLKYFPRNERL